MPTINRNRETLFTGLLDGLVLCMAWYFLTQIKPELTSHIAERENLSIIVAGGIHTVYWLIVFSLMGLYKRLYLISRFDEFVKVVKATLIGTLILYFYSTIDGDLQMRDRLASVTVYVLLVGGLITVNRFVIRSIQRFYALKGKGLHRALIIGTGKNAVSAFDDLNRNRSLGMQVVGFIEVPNGKNGDQVYVDPDEIMGSLDDINLIIQELEIQDLIVALEPEKREDLIKVLSRVNNPDVTLKLLPDFYQLVSGLNKTNQIFGLPLIEISPDLMPFWEKLMKRLLDVIISVAVLIVMLPVIIVISIVIRLTSKGPAIYSQERVGKKGKLFTMYKFRTMRMDAEAETGPTWAQENDPRITKVGAWLRKTRLDEIPQFYNVLKGEMSLVGPRPERPYFVSRFKDEIPMYTRRLRVRPGITGWAQVKWKYDGSLDDVKEKTKYDLFYVENMSLRMDFKILINTIFSMVRAKGQ
ncbi:sugar transferase [Rhodohalobacter sp. 8-1]|uniref:sugar transferase n=1 Tax=Rhodohalobacter sp. 8-1 TaxID=3131972 RepID=UPI0030ED0AE8